MSSGGNPPSVLQYVLTRQYGPRLCTPKPTGGHVADKLRRVWEPLTVDIGNNDKIFASLWIRDDTILMGSKNNRLTLLSTRYGRYWDLPLIGDPTDTPELRHCKIGIHAIQKNDSGTLVATGGANVNEIGVYDRGMSPAYLLKNFHRHCVFDMRWLRDDVLISCSRDGRMGIWHLEPLERPSAPPLFVDSESLCTPFGSNYDPMVINSPVAVSEPMDISVKFRALEYLPTRNVVALVTMLPELFFFDVETYFGTSQLVRAPLFTLTLSLVAHECVAIRRWPSNPHFFALASQRSVITFDIRDRNYRRSVMRLIDNPDRFPTCIRSVNFSGDVLSYGTALGKVYFFDMRMERHLDYYIDVDKTRLERQPQNLLDLAQSDSSQSSQSIEPTSSPTGSADGSQTVNLAESRAVYTHEYNSDGSQLFTAGGPIGTAFNGYFATIWR